MKNSIVILFSFLLIQTLSGQNSYEYLHSNLNDQVPSTIIEDNGGNLIFAFNDKNELNANIYKLNYSGQVIDSIVFFNPGGKCEFKELLKISDTTFACFGIYPEYSTFNLWYCKFDFNLNELKNVKIEVDEKIWSYYMSAIINNSGNIVLSTIYEIESLNTDVCVFEISLQGDLLQEKYFQTLSSGVVLCQDIIQIPNSHNYFLITNSFYTKFTGQIVKIDSVFNILEISPLPWFINDLHTAKIINDSIFLVSSKEAIDTKGYKVLGLSKMDFNATCLDTTNFGPPNIDNWPGFHQNLDLINSNKIFYGGVSNIDIFNPFFSSMPNWFFLNKLDVDFNIIWQKYYGGDACYNLYSILATQDGGCVMAGSRYDYQTQNQERDVYILKVDEDGILTWRQNIPAKKLQNLVYPNPGHQRVTVNSGERGKSIEFYSITSEIVLKTYLDTETTEIDVSSFSTGVYFYRVLNKTGKVVGSGKWIKQ